MIRQPLYASVLVSYIDLTVVRVEGGSLIIDVTRGLVHAIDSGEVVIARSDLAKQLTVVVVNVEMHISVTVGRDEDIVIANLDTCHSLFLNIFLHTLFEQKMSHGAARVDGIEIQNILMARHGIDEHFVGIGRGFDSWHVAVGIDGHLELLDTVTLDVVAPGRDLGVVRSSLRIFVTVQSRIFSILLALGVAAFVQLERVLLHVLLIVAKPAEHRAVGIEGHGGVELELLLIDPVGNAIDDLVELPVFRHLVLSIVVEQLDEEDVVVAHEGDLQTIGRPDWTLLRPTVGELLELAALNGINIELSLVGTAVDRLPFCGDEHPCAIRRHNVAVEGGDLLALRVVNIEKHGGTLARLEGIFFYPLAVGRNACILIGAFDGVDARDSFCCKLARCDLLERDGLRSSYRAGQHKQ